MMKKPCDLCLARNCPQEGCKAWQDWFAQRWEGIQEAVWKWVDQGWKQKRDRFTYELPHLRRSPCIDCPCESWCRKACAGKRSWDRRAYAPR